MFLKHNSKKTLLNEWRGTKKEVAAMIRHNLFPTVFQPFNQSGLSLDVLDNVHYAAVAVHHYADHLVAERQRCGIADD